MCVTIYLRNEATLQSPFENYGCPERKKLPSKHKLINKDLNDYLCGYNSKDHF